MKRLVLLTKTLPFALLTAGVLLVGACSDDEVIDDSTDAGGSRDGAADTGVKDATADRAELGVGGSGGSSGAAGSPGDAGIDADATGGSAGADATGGSAGATYDGAADAAPDVSVEAAADGARDATSDCGVPGPLTTPTVPSALQPPPGATLARRFYAAGSQIYTCKGGLDAGADGGAAYAWTFTAPSADLYDDSCTAAGTHFAGPTWQSSGDGSSVRGSPVGNVAGATGAIPWLLLRAVANNGEGIFSTVTAVQRLDTAGGVVPTTGCSASTVGATQNVPYTATYYFYTGGTWPVPEAGADAEAGASDGAAESSVPDAAHDASSADAVADAVTEGG